MSEPRPSAPGLAEGSESAARRTARAARDLGGLLATFWLIALVVALLPSRVAWAAHQAQFAGSAWQLTVVGVAVDLPFAVASFVAANAVGMGLWALLRRRAGGSRSLVKFVLVSTAAAFGFVLFGCISATEFKVERGLYPTVFDLKVGLADSGYVRSALGTFLLARFVWGTLAALAGFIGLGYWFVRAADRSSTRPLRAQAGSLLLPLAACAGMGFGLHRASPHLFSSIANWRVVESPFPSFFASLGSSHENIRFGYIALIEHMGSPEPARELGAASIGLSPNAARALARSSECAAHPLAEAYPRAVSSEPGPGVNAAFASRVEHVADELSRELWSDRKRVRVWQISLESMRADDLAAWNEKAPPGLAPTLNGLYARASEPNPRVVVARHMYQAGVRTSQGLSAFTCGTGTMPWGISFARDVGLVPFRCLPDVLKDAGFATYFYYGSNPAFDNMQAFLHYHGIHELMTERDYVEEKKHKGWAVPDRIVYAQSLARSNARPHDESQYNLLMTLSHHHPFDRPEDFTDEDAARVRSLVGDVGADHLKRLDTLHYADRTLGEMLEKLEASEAAADSLVVIAGDHATSDYFLWRGADKLEGVERLVALSRIPFVLVLPEALLARSRNRARVHELVRELNQALAEQALSQNDVPRLLLALLARAPAMGVLPEGYRWHSLGGQALSPYFRLEAAPGARVIGVNAASRVYWVDATGPVDPGEPAAPVFDSERARETTPSLLSQVSVYSAFLSQYGRRCWDWSNVRKVK